MKLWHAISILAFIVIVSLIILIPGWNAQTASFAPVSGGGTLLSLFHVLVQGVNQANMTGYYWFATLLLNNGAQQLTSFQVSAAQAAAASVGGAVNVSGSQQSDSFSVDVQKNQLVYSPSGGVQYGLNTYSLVQPSLSMSYTNCNGQSVNGNTGSLATATIGCSLNQTGWQGYVKACKLVIASQVSNATGVAVAGSSGFSSGLYCFALKAKPWATISQFGAAQVNEQVQVSINGASVTVNSTNKYAAHTNSTGKVDLAVTLIPPGNGGTFFGGPPIQSQYALYSNSTGSKLITLASYTNLQGTMLGVQNNVSTIEGCNGYWAWGLGSGYQGLCSYQGVDYVNVSSVLGSLNNQLVSKLVANPLNSSMTLQGTSLIFNDPTFQYLTPEIQIVSGLPLLGISVAACNPNIIKVTPATFYSNGYNYSSITVQNTASVAAVCTVTIVNATPGINFGSQQQFLIPAGGTHTFNFTISSSVYIAPDQYGAINFGTYKVCDAVTGTDCAYRQTIFYEQPACSGSIVSGNTCENVTTISVPTTTTICTQNCATTTAPPTTFETCPAGYHFNETLYNEGLKFYCSPDGRGVGIQVWEIVVAVVLVIIAFGGYLKLRKPKRGERT